MSNFEIVRVPKHENFSVIDNTFLRDKSLSLKAKGLMAFMLSLPPTWDLSVMGLVEVTGAGRDAIYSTLKELKAAGYLVMEQQQGQQGQFSKVIYRIMEYPHTEQPHTDSPLTDNPYTVCPYTENPTQINTKLNKDLFKINTDAPQAEEDKSDTYPKRFKKPTLDEVRQYIQLKNLSVNASDFFNYFEAGDWHDSKGKPVKNWKQKLLTWNKYNTSPSQQQPQSVNSTDLIKQSAERKQQSDLEAERIAQKLFEAGKL